MNIKNYTGLIVACYLLATSLPTQAFSPAQTGLFAEGNDASSVALNPAAMTRLDKTTKAMQGIFILSLGEFDVDNNVSTAGGDPDNELTPIIIPAFYYVTPLSDDWRFGFSVNVPSGFGAQNGNSWSGRYYSDEFALVYIALTPAIAYKVNSKLSLGGAASLTYNYSKSLTHVNNGAGFDDGELEFEADTLILNTSISMLYEFNDNTRIGMVYGTEGSSDLEGDLEFSNLSPALDTLLTNLNLKDAEFSVENIIPQRVQFGIYHQFDDKSAITFDTVWVDFSEFGTGDISFNGNDIESSEGIYNDIWVASVGYSWPVSNTKTYKVGLMHVTSAVDDDKRSLSFALDRIWGIGAGITLKRPNNHWDINVNLYDLGNAPIDTGNSPVRGRVVGETSNPYSFMIDASYHW